MWLVSIDALKRGPWKHTLHCAPGGCQKKKLISSNFEQIHIFYIAIEVLHWERYDIEGLFTLNPHISKAKFSDFNSKM